MRHASQAWLAAPIARRGTGAPSGAPLPSLFKGSTEDGDRRRKKSKHPGGGALANCAAASSTALNSLPWFETRSFAALLTMREHSAARCAPYHEARRGLPAYSDLILRSGPKDR